MDLMEKGKKLGLAVGCNYPTTRDILRGCHNDALVMHKTLMERFGFKPNSVKLLMDIQGNTTTMPTGKNMKKELNSMIDQAHPGDVLFFYFSGHGMLWQPSNSRKKVEAIVASDLNIITCVDFRHMVDRVRKGISSCSPCHRIVSLSLSNWPDQGILLSGCQSNEYSYELRKTDSITGQINGAFTNAFLIILKQNHAPSLSNTKIILVARNILRRQGYDKQHPCLYCTKKNSSAIFLTNTTGRP